VVLDLLERLGFTLWDEAMETRDASGKLLLLDGLAEFREHLGGELTLTMLRDIGEAFDVHEMDEPLVLSCLDVLRARAARAGAA
jgi:3-dehydroquinate synthase